MGEKNNNPKGVGGFQQHPENINRNGAPNKGNTFRDILIKKLNENYIYADPGKTYKEALVEAWLECAIHGSYSHLKEILERMDGKVSDMPIGLGDKNIHEHLSEIAEAIRQRDLE